MRRFEIPLVLAIIAIVVAVAAAHGRFAGSGVLSGVEPVEESRHDDEWISDLRGRH